MAEIISVDEFISEEWYPGFTPAYGHSPWVTEPVDTFKAGDQERFWFLDFHFPRGLSPMGMVFLEDGYSWATQLAARTLPLPRGNGIVQRLAGTHVYASVVPVDSEWEAGLRAERFGRNLPRFLDGFAELWASRVWELETGLAHFEQYDLTGRSLDELGHYLRDARSFHRRAWEIHFEVMYPLLANYIGFRALCGDLGIDPGQISKFLQGYDTKILECDRELWTLTAAARQAGLG
ncbi:MAG: pyruvate, water dikinase, partial [Actinomycetota bacterium]|nr:pyruvate, water dikinase [Actinomycetota bacterium]